MEGLDPCRGESLTVEWGLEATDREDLVVALEGGNQ
jgi:hypothetical protein